MENNRIWAKSRCYGYTSYKSLYEALKGQSLQEALVMRSLENMNTTLSQDNERLTRELEHVQEISQEELMNLVPLHWLRNSMFPNSKTGI